MTPKEAAKELARFANTDPDAPYGSREDVADILAGRLDPPVEGERAYPAWLVLKDLPLDKVAEAIEEAFEEIDQAAAKFRKRWNWDDGEMDDGLFQY